MLKALTASSLLLLPLLAFGNPFTPSTTGYYSQAQFVNAAMQAVPAIEILTDNFTYGAPSLPGVSVSSDVTFDGYDKGAGQGRFVDGAYLDTTEKYSVTVWSFDQLVYAFGGDWDLGAINAGLEIEAGGIGYFIPDTSVTPLSSYGWNNRPAWPASDWSGFWGFVSTVPIYSVEIFSGDEGLSNSFAQSYKFTGMEIATAIPEPSTVSLFGLAAALIGIGVIRRGWRKQPR